MPVHLVQVLEPSFGKFSVNVKLRFYCEKLQVGLIVIVHIVLIYIK